MLITSEYIQYYKHLHQLYIASEFFAGCIPNEVEVQSRNTGRIVKYVPDNEKAMKNEFWDGCQMEYYAPEDNSLPRLVVAHEY